MTCTVSSTSVSAGGKPVNAKLSFLVGDVGTLGGIGPVWSPWFECSCGIVFA